MVLDVNAADANGITPVMMAAQWGRAPRFVLQTVEGTNRQKSRVFGRGRVI